jgi:uncharacterized protein YecT (DUF1311 family)
MKRSVILESLLLYIFILIVSSAAFAGESENLSKTYKNCMDKADGVTMNMHECIAAEIIVQDKRLNGNYSHYIKDLTPERRKKMVDLQRLWIKYRDLKCEFYYDPDGGTFAGLVSHTCMLDMTAERADELQENLH